MTETANTKFVAYIAANGWTLDPTATILKNHFGSHADRVQDPHVFVRPAAHGGFWRIKLDYSAPSYSRTGFRRLQEVHVYYVPVLGENPPRRRAATLKRPGKYGSFNPLWVALDTTGQQSLRKRAERLVANPDLAMWLSFQAKHDENVREAEWVEQRRRDRELRNRPLPVTVDEIEWAKLKYAAARAASAVERADGRSDLPALVAALRAATDAIEGVLAQEVSA
jgi:hypothetical protein